jgi:hypothetical protein
LWTVAFNLETLGRLGFWKETDESAVAKFEMDKSDVTCGFPFFSRKARLSSRRTSPCTFLSQTTTFSNIEIAKWRGAFPRSIFLVDWNKEPPHALVVNPQPIYSIFWCLAIHARLAGKRDSKRHTLECGGRGVHGACVHTNLARASHTTCDIPAAPPPSQQDPARRSHRPRERPPPFLQLHRF